MDQSIQPLRRDLLTEIQTFATTSEQKQDAKEVAAELGTSAGALCRHALSLFLADYHAKKVETTQNEDLQNG